MKTNLRLRLVSLGAGLTLLAGVIQPVAADGGGGIGGDANATTVTSTQTQVDPNGPADATQVNVTATTSDSGAAGNIQMGTPTGSTSAPCPLERGITHLTDNIPLPPVKIVSGPPANAGAVAGVPTWFWADGYTGDWWKPQSLAGYWWSCALDPNNGDHIWTRHDVSVPVVIWAADYAWDFGDGQKHVGSCGSDAHQGDCADSALGVKDSPAVSNTYTSTSVGLAKGYTVKVAVSFMAMLDGQANVTLGPFTQGDNVSLPVREIQSVLVPVPAP